MMVNQSSTAQTSSFKSKSFLVRGKLNDIKSTSIDICPGLTKPSMGPSVSAGWFVVAAIAFTTNQPTLTKAP